MGEILASWYSKYVELCELSGVRPLSAHRVIATDGVDVVSMSVKEIFIRVHNEEPFEPLSTEVVTKFGGEDISDLEETTPYSEKAMQVAASIVEKRIDESYVLSKIAGMTYTLLPSGRTIVCEVTMVNGATFTGQYYSPSDGSYSEEAGKASARAEAIHRIVVCEQYLYREEQYKAKRVTVDL